ncbi:MAG TPA: SusD/RagB family nutrient-binding outer membrane lipoprotein [Flavipsychrobacter sp.]|uniref:SusD/RagB family nutrient-binding outer membrane lipoprotein n=1 Tax=Agriterribacter sp. TaxID=2821509 RepID=UPI002B6CFF18|nr:SusD/RagB family nutrient-binding outer membrane lipoprotein [Agriterribacter sp.]HTN09160.1 SusD/RagB family nutrient-binding outer membrane lipoprotein [Agriterribacter sp.]HTN47787.1 SusD/RagB family nutrient-binding outer membrane lipoprotein [Flavipsychrobacter sp.]
MKTIKYIMLGSLLLAGVSCSKDQLRMGERETSFNVNYFTYSRYQLTTAIVDVAYQYGKGVIDEPVEEATLYFLECYNGGSQAATLYTNAAQNWDYQGSNPYTQQLRTLKALSLLATNEDNMANVAVANILKCVVGGSVTEKYGDIPFSEAMQGRDGDLFPKFDSQKEVYEQMFTLLDDAVSILSDAGSKGLPAEHDVLFNGDRSKWIKFANSLKFRLMVHSYEAFKKAGRDLSGEMQAIASGNNYMSAVADNAGLEFSGVSERESWYLQTTWGTGNNFTEQKPSKYLIDQMVALDDPRMYVIFAPALSPISAKATESSEDIKINGYTYNITYYPSSLYEPSEIVASGRDLDGNVISVPYPLDAKWVGAPNPINVQTQYASSTSLPGTNSFYDNRRITGLSRLVAGTNGPSLKGVIMEASEMMFLLAEARQKGWISAGNTKDYYENGIKLSFERWQIENGTKPATQIGSDKIVDNFSAYYAKPAVALDGSAADLDKIAIQKWLSMLMTNHTEAYTDYRRTGKPAFVGKIVTSFSTYEYPMRYLYPLDESSNNKEQYDAAVSAMGGKDIASVKMWILQ